jgi:hypothetical protein
VQSALEGIAPSFPGFCLKSFIIVLQQIQPTLPAQQIYALP